MTEDPTPPPSQARESLMVWVKFVGLLVALGVFCLIIFRLSRSLH